MAIIFGIGAFQAVVFSLLLLMKKDKRQAEMFLAGFFFVITLYFAHLVSFFYSVWRSFPELVLIITLVPLFYGPLLFFYVESLIKGEVKRRTLYIHLIPIVITFLIILPYVSLSYEDKLLYFTDRFINLPLYLSVGIFVQYISAPLYFIRILYVIRAHNRRLKASHSVISGVNLGWLKMLLIGAVSIWTLDVLYVILLNYTPIAMSVYISWSIKVVFLMFTVLIGFFGIKQDSLSNHSITNSARAGKVSDNNAKQITDKSADRLQRILLDYMESEKAYINSELRIQDISNALSIPVHQLSYVINRLQQQNFFDFVNSYRVNEVKIKLANPAFDDLTLIAIAYDCGFNSKASFNRLFKQYTGKTPTQFKKESRTLSQH